MRRHRCRRFLSAAPAARPQSRPVGTFWFLLVGVLLITVALLGRFLDRLPVSLAMIYLLVGFALGPAASNALELHPMRQLELLQTITEIALLIALFTVGIKLRVPVGDWRWSLPLRLATVSMVLTIAAVAAAGIWLLGLSPGMALLLGAILAPTDPVLASDVQLRSAHDRDTLRFALTGEGGLNDGTAFPFVLLGLGLLGLHDIGSFGLRWLAVDLVWGTVGGLGIGFLVGMGVAARRAAAARLAARRGDLRRVPVVRRDRAELWRRAGGAHAGFPGGVRRGAGAASRR